MQDYLEFLIKNNIFREIKNVCVQDKFIFYKNQKLLNLASNDYLGIASNTKLKNIFLEQNKHKNLYFGSGASRLVYSASSQYEKLQNWFENKFLTKKALIFNSGYSANFSFISSFADKNTLFLADKLIHASMIDALKTTNYKRFAHNDTNALANLLEKNYKKFKKIIILCEALYSMDGDFAPLKKIYALAKEFNALLYVDEAHSFFALNPLGQCYEQGIQADFTLITLSKALGGFGSVLLVDDISYKFLVNKARSLIYSTALPPINIAWTNFILEQNFTQNRQNLAKNIEFLNANSQILPFLCSCEEEALNLANKLFELGYFVATIRKPSVKTPRLRISLRGDIMANELETLSKILCSTK